VTISGQPVCAFPCSDAGDCPSGLSCVPDDDSGRGWCGPGTIPIVNDDRIDTGCQCRAGARPSTRHAALPFIILIVALALRPRRG
jgi:MYXO-CTERM domain-containing protein